MQVFQYVNSQYRSVMCDDENAFDIFCSDAEEYVGQQVCNSKSLNFYNCVIFVPHY